MNVTFLSALIFVAVFAGVILIHEFGHFLVGRLLKVDAEEFGVGLPPRILTLFRWKGTAFTLNWLPLGGFVRFKGETDPNVPGGLTAASAWVRLAVMAAGPLMNLLSGVAVFSLLFYQVGIPDFSQVQIGEVSPNSPAGQAGLQANDVIVEAAGQRITDPGQLHDVIYSHLDRPVPFFVRRGQETLTITATPLSTRPEGQGALGITMGPALVSPGSWIQAVPYGFAAVYSQARLLISLPAQMIRGTLSPEEGRFVGLKGIYDLFGQAVSRDVESRAPAPAASLPPSPTYFTLQLIAVLTVSIGLFNLLPFPALDGGHILFVLPELVLRRRVSPEFENLVHYVGLALLLAFMVYVNVMDFINPARINLP